MAAASQLLVVDTSVARACGESDRPPAPQVLAVLRTIYKICHRAVVSNELNAEWERHTHKNRAFNRWRTQMLNKRKLIRRPLRRLDEIRNGCGYSETTWR